MNKTFLITLLCLPCLLAAATLSLTLSFPPPLEGSSGITEAGYGSLTAPGLPQLPCRTINVILPPAAQDLEFSHAFGDLAVISAPAPAVNPAFFNSEGSLVAPERSPGSQQVHFQGIGRWGEVCFASFRVLPAIHDGAAWQWYRSLQLELSWTEASTPSPNRIPPVLRQLEKSSALMMENFFANPADLAKWYQDSPTKNYDYLIVGTPALYSAIALLESYRQSQGMITAFADIAVILAQTPGANSAEKLRNYLVDQYNASPFTYLLLLGDHDTVPVAQLTPEPDGYDTIPSDFYYSDLSSIFDTDNDGRLGEYSTGFGDQDWGMDFTPELFVGRISTNSTTLASTIAQRIVAYDQSTAAWKNKALLPAAFLNYQGEPETIYMQTDGAGFMEYARATSLANTDCTTMYEQLGVVPSYPSDYALDYGTLQDLISTESFGILNWSAHGSATSSSRKVWMEDSNQNQLPDDFEMQWFNMVNRTSFDNLVNQDGMIIFAASCYNGRLDNITDCLAERALQRKGVAVMAATRTGWYKIGWANPGWGGLSSYNHHVLENHVQHGLSIGAAVAWANLIHTQYYLFGDPVDAGGIIWPELQNVYTYLLFGDPAVGHQGSQVPPQGEILVFEPFHQDGLPVVNALADTGRFNVIYSDRLIPDYDYINQFEAVFCLFGWGNTAYILTSGSLEYNLLNSYLENGGRMYLEGMVNWDPTDLFWGKFGTSAPLDFLVPIENVRYLGGDQSHIWAYDEDFSPAQILVAEAPSAIPVFSTANSDYPDVSIGIYNSNGSYATIGSTFSLTAILDGDFSLEDIVADICDTLHIGSSIPVSNHDPAIPAVSASVPSFPNPFRSGTTLRFELPAKNEAKAGIYNLRGQQIRTLSPGTLAPGSHDLFWDGTDHRGIPCAPGIYLYRLDLGGQHLSGKLLKLK